MPKVLAAVALALLALIGIVFGWHLLGGLWSLVGQLVSVALTTLATAIQLAVTVITGLFVIGCTLLIALGILVIIWLAFQRAIETVAKWVREASEEAKAAATDATALAILAGVIGVLAFLTTGDFLNSKELSLPKALTVSSMFLVLLKMALYMDSSHVRRAVWPLLLLAYLAPFVFGYYLYSEECSEKHDLNELTKCMLDLRPPKDEAHVAPMQIAGHFLIAVLTALAMLFPFRLATWRRFLGIRKSTQVSPVIR